MYQRKNRHEEDFHNLIIKYFLQPFQQLRASVSKQFNDISPKW